MQPKSLGVVGRMCAVTVFLVSTPIGIPSIFSPGFFRRKQLMVKCDKHQRWVGPNRDGRYLCTAVPGDTHELLAPRRGR